MAELRFPIRDPSDELATDFGEVVRGAVADGQLTDTEASIAREIRTRLVLDGARTSADALERLEGLGAAGQRQWLDEARIACGLPSETELEQRREQRRIEARFCDHDIPGPPPWDPLQRCPQCGTYPTKDGGAWTEVSVEKWWCPEHRDLAQPGDMEPHQPAYYIGVNGRPIPSEREKARIAAEIRKRDEPLERERQQREEHARREAEALEEVERNYQETATINILGVQCHPDGRIVNP